MPIYEYKCGSCGHELERLQRISDEPLTDCPECGEAGLRRLVSAAGFRLKGAGWYETDFKKEGKKNLHESPADKSSKPKESGDAKSAEPAAGKKAPDKSKASAPTSDAA
jgi:putative FmdB family regulatory protein